MKKRLLIACLLVSFIYVESSDANPNWYFKVIPNGTCKIVKVGNPIYEGYTIPFGKNKAIYTDGLKRPVMVSLKVSCNPKSETIYTKNIETKQVYDKWGHWNLNIMPIEHHLRLFCRTTPESMKDPEGYTSKSNIKGISQIDVECMTNNAIMYKYDPKEEEENR